MPLINSFQIAKELASNKTDRVTNLIALLALVAVLLERREKLKKALCIISQILTEKILLNLNAHLKNNHNGQASQMEPYRFGLQMPQLIWSMTMKKKSFAE